MYCIPRVTLSSTVKSDKTIIEIEIPSCSRIRDIPKNFIINPIAIVCGNKNAAAYANNNGVFSSMFRTPVI